jgi:hypothetical protein
VPKSRTKKPIKIWLLFIKRLNALRFSFICSLLSRAYYPVSAIFTTKINVQISFFF